MYGKCTRCYNNLTPVWFKEKEYNYIKGSRFPTGRQRDAVDYLLCENCGQKEIVDGSFDKAWYKGTEEGENMND